MKSIFFFLIKWILVLISIKVFFSIINVKILDANVIGKPTSMMSDWVNEINENFKYFFIVAILAPIMEEILFRSILTKNSILLSLVVGVLGYFLVRIHSQNSYYIINENTPIAVVIGVIGFL